MKTFLLITILFFCAFASTATIHVVKVWEGYYQFNNPASPFIVELGDTIQWLPLDFPMMVHTITSTNIPAGAEPFDQIWQAPADTFFQYVPTVIGVYEYQCTPHVEFNMVSGFTVVEPTSVEGNGLSNSNVRIYPNPATEFLNIDFSKSESTLEIQLYDHSGQQVKLSDLNTETIPNHSTLSLEGLPAGMYYLIFREENRTFTKKFLKI